MDQGGISLCSTRIGDLFYKSVSIVLSQILLWKGVGLRCHSNSNFYLLVYEEFDIVENLKNRSWLPDLKYMITKLMHPFVFHFPPPQKKIEKNHMDNHSFRNTNVMVTQMYTMQIVSCDLHGYDKLLYVFLFSHMLVFLGKLYRTFLFNILQHVFLNILIVYMI